MYLHTFLQFVFSLLPLHLDAEEAFAVVYGGEQGKASSIAANGTDGEGDIRCAQNGKKRDPENLATEKSSI